MKKNINLSDYNKTELELFESFYKDGHKKLLLGSSERLRDGFDRYIEEQNNGTKEKTT